MAEEQAVGGGELVTKFEFEQNKWQGGEEGGVGVVGVLFFPVPAKTTGAWS